MTPDEIQAIKKRCDDAVPAPWQDEITDDGELLVMAGPGHDIFFGDMENTCAQCHANARFVAHAREDVPALLAEVERLRARLAELEVTG